MASSQQQHQQQSPYGHINNNIHNNQLEYDEFEDSINERVYEGFDDVPMLVEDDNVGDSEEGSVFSLINYKSVQGFHLAIVFSRHGRSKRDRDGIR